MTTLAIALAGPLAAFGNGSHERYRSTALLPTKSAVCGLIGACLGRDYADDMRDLFALKVHVRADQPGLITTDFQTVEGTWRASGKANPDRIIVQRQLLQDCAFTVVVEGPAELLEQIGHALQNPHFMPYLGLRACPVSRPLYLGPPREETPEEVFAQLPYLGGTGEKREIYTEDEHGTLTWSDQPSRSPHARRFIRRKIRTGSVQRPETPSLNQESPTDAPDA